MYNFISGSECHLHLHSSCLQKLIYINVSPLPVEGDVIIGQVWTCLCLRSVIYTQTEVFSRADFGGHARAGWYPMAVAPEGHNQELPIFSIFPWDPPNPGASAVAFLGMSRRQIVIFSSARTTPCGPMEVFSIQGGAGCSFCALQGHPQH